MVEVDEVFHVVGILEISEMALAGKFGVKTLDDPSITAEAHTDLTGRVTDEGLWRSRRALSDTLL